MPSLHSLSKDFIKKKKNMQNRYTGIQIYRFFPNKWAYCSLSQSYFLSIFTETYINKFRCFNLTL